jgi:hypothetical protein
MPSPLVRRIGAPLALSGILGLGILLTDKILQGATDHFYALILFVIVDFLLSGLVVAKPDRTAFKLAAIWCTLRILLQLADISQAPVYQFTYAQFADYLFNPVSSLSSSLGNPPGVPGILLDLIIVLELVIVVSVAKPTGSTQRVT